ncbi:hypothetical protein V8G54_023065 [Vigna mungo]|uniref:Hexosyltransferase n=1 Tax=Vigna mungo TaxID=3915 RepID=A0AAQ3RNT6_VIGMU
MSHILAWFGFGYNVDCSVWSYVNLVIVFFWWVGYFEGSWFVNGGSCLEEATGLAFRFIIGRTSDRGKMSALHKEVAEYDDFILLDIQEEYTAYALFDAEFYVKADDDIYLRPVWYLASPHVTLKASTCSQHFIILFLMEYEPLSNLLGKEYFLHAYGPIYALSADVVSSLVALRNDRQVFFPPELAWPHDLNFRMFSNEDVTIGAWMLAMNVNHENNHELCATDCTATSVAVWDIPKCSGLCNPEKKMLELHQKETCSKTPTLESDDE